MQEAHRIALQADARRLAHAVEAASLMDICRLPNPLREALIRLRTAGEITAERIESAIGERE